MRKLQLFLLRREQGQPRWFEREIRDYGHEFPSPLMHQAVLAHVYASTQQTESRGDLLQRASAPRPLELACRRGVARQHLPARGDLRILDDAARAAPLYELLVPYGSQNAVALPEFALDSAAWPLGILANLRGRFEDAVDHFQQALRMNEKMGALPWAAHTQQDHARMLLRRNAPGDREHADDLLSRARATYRDLGMHDAAERAAAFDRTGTHAQAGAQRRQRAGAHAKPQP